MYRHMSRISEALADGRVVEIGEEQVVQLADVLIEDGLDAVPADPVRSGTVCSFVSSGKGAVNRTVTF